jgi:hypothetical protein
MDRARAFILVARPDGKAQTRFSWPLLLTTTGRHQINPQSNLSWPATAGHPVGHKHHIEEKNIAKLTAFVSPGWPALRRAMTLSERQAASSS